jgi:ABC-2 type transport system ATP-binding protein
MHAVEISNVTKIFGDVRAVDGLTLDVVEGAVYGFIGPNGSGKTTTMRMIVNISHISILTLTCESSDRLYHQYP